jgi:hypothetical protein
MFTVYIDGEWETALNTYEHAMEYIDTIADSPGYLLCVWEIIHNHKQLNRGKFGR